MIKRSPKRSVKARNPVAKRIREPLYHLRLKPSKKLYQRKPKHRGRPSEADLGLGVCSASILGLTCSLQLRTRLFSGS